MIVVYAKIPVADIRKDCTETIAKIKMWFSQNPKRRICNVEVWYGKMIKVRKNFIKEDMEAARDEALKDD